MDTQIAETNEHLSSLDHRLSGVEKDMVVLTTDMAVVKATMATKDDLGKIQNDVDRLRVMMDNCATKADLLGLDTRIMRWMVTTLITVAGMNTALVLIVVRLLHV